LSLETGKNPENSQPAVHSNPVRPKCALEDLPYEFDSILAHGVLTNKFPLLVPN